MIRRRRYRTEWLLLVAAAISLGGFVGFLKHAEYVRIDRQEHERLASQAALLEKNLVPRLVAANRAIESVIEELPRWRSEVDGVARAGRRLEVLSETLLGIRTLVVMDASGRVFASNRGELVGRDLAKQPNFQRVLRQPDPRTLYLTPPFKTVLGTYSIALMRMIAGPDGRFAGVVLAIAEPAYFETLLESVRYVPDVRSFVIHGDGTLFMMSPERPELAGRGMT